MTELLIVIAIIGILVSVVLYYLSGAKEKAKVVEFKSQVSSVVAAVVIECSGGSWDPDNVELPPGISWDTQPICDWAGWSNDAVLETTNVPSGCTATINEAGVVSWGANCT